MSHAEGIGRPDRSDGSEDEHVLRAKYLDYCSARLAEVLLRLSADEIYLLAEGAAVESREGDARSHSYEDVVRRATEQLSRQLALPSFDVWATAYREDPSRFDNELLGLWQSEASVHQGSDAEGGTRQGTRDEAAPRGSPDDPGGG